MFSPATSLAQGTLRGADLTRTPNIGEFASRGMGLGFFTWAFITAIPAGPIKLSFYSPDPGAHRARYSFPSSLSLVMPVRDSTTIKSS